MIRTVGLGKEYDGEEILKGIDLTVHDGEVIGLIGPSGAGKSLLLRLLGMLEKPSSGKIFLGDDEITSPSYDIRFARKRIGMVFQNPSLFPHLTVVENVMTGLVHLERRRPTEAFDMAMELLREVGLYDMAFRYPYSLSGGQNQRAAIARTMALRPEILLFDEPTSSLDPIMQGEVEAVIRMLAEKGHTMIISSHEMGFIRNVCDRIVFLNNGTVFEEGSPAQIFENAGKAETRRFVRALRLLEFTITSADFDFIGMQTEVAEFAYKAGIPANIVRGLNSVTEEFTQMIILSPKEKNIMKMSFEYNRDEKTLDGEVRFSGPPFDEDNPIYFISWPIIRKRTASLRHTEIDEDGYTNLLSFRIM